MRLTALKKDSLPEVPQELTTYNVIDAAVSLIQLPLMLMEKLDLSSPCVYDVHLRVDSVPADGPRGRKLNTSGKSAGCC